MSFVYPTFLYALLAILIPIIIHLFNFRKYKKIYFTNVKFLKELKEESQSKSKLKELLILLSRILAISSLVLAFAQPIIVNKEQQIKKGPKTIGIYIDNSFSMESVNKNGTLLNNAKKRAIEIIHAFSNSDRFQILTNDFEGRHQRFLSGEEAIENINEIAISSAVKPLSSVIKRQNEFLKSSKNTDLRQFILSDMQKSTCDIANLISDSLVSSVIVPLTANNNDNLFVDTCWFDSPIQQKGIVQKLNIRISNKGSKTIESGTVKLIINKKQVAIASFNINPESNTETKITFECKEEGFNFCSLKTDDYPVSFDDELFFAFNSKLNINTLVVNGKQTQTGSYFKSLMSNDSLFRFKEMHENNIDYAFLKNANLVVLNEIEIFTSGLLTELDKYLDNGGHLVFIPSSKYDANNLNNFYKSFNLPLINGTDSIKLKLDKTDFKQGFYEGVFDKVDDRVDLPVVLKHYLYNSNIKNQITPILKLQNGETWLGNVNSKNGKIYLFSGSLNLQHSNFCKHALFVPTIYKMVINSIKPLSLYYYTQTNSTIFLNSENQKTQIPPHIKGISNPKYDIIPESKVINNRVTLFTQNQVQEPGFYTINAESNSLLPLAFNYNRLESQLDFYTQNDISNKIEENHLNSFKTLVAGEKSLSSGLKEINGNTKLWKLFIILSLLFIAAEIALIRFLK